MMSRHFKLCDFTALVFLKHKSTMTDDCCFFLSRQLCDFTGLVFLKHKSKMTGDCSFFFVATIVISLPECSLNTNPKWPIIVVFYVTTIVWFYCPSVQHKTKMIDDCCFFVTIVILLPECSLNTNPKWLMIVTFYVTTIVWFHFTSVP